jgi:hypothetical protein
MHSWTPKENFGDHIETTIFVQKKNRKNIKHYIHKQTTSTSAMESKVMSLLAMKTQ